MKKKKPKPPKLLHRWSRYEVVGDQGWYCKLGVYQIELSDCGDLEIRTFGLRAESRATAESVVELVLYAGLQEIFQKRSKRRKQCKTKKTD